MAETCVFYANWDGEQPLCGEPAIGTFTGACVHEHVQTLPLCAADAAELQRCMDMVVCRRCEVSAEPHRCPVTITFDWHEAVAS
jgi:hypothetical protein